MSSRRGSLRRILLVSFIASGYSLSSNFLMPLAAQAPAQPYSQLTLPPAFTAKDGPNTVLGAAQAAVRETGPLSSTGKEALRLAAEYYMVRMTQLPRLNDPKEKVLLLPDAARRDLTNLVTPASPEGKSVISKAVVVRAVEIINGHYMPAAKINAMLILSEGKLLPNETIGALWKFTTDPKVPAHLRCLAIVGVENQLRAMGTNMPEGQRTAVAAGVAAIVKSRPISLTEEKAHWWLVRRGYELLGTLHSVGTPSGEGVHQAMEHLMDPNTAPSVRLSAAKYLSNYDLSAVPPVIKNKILVAVAQLLDQEVVGWYEQEDDKLKMASGAGSMSGYGGGYGGDSMMSGMSSGGDAYDPSASAAMSGYEMGMGSSASAGPKPIDTQKWDMRLARRKLNTYCEVAHVLLDGKASATQEKRSNANPKSKGLMEADLPEPLQRPGEKLLEALDKVQVAINERTLTTVSTLMTKSVQSLEELRSAAEMVPGVEGADGTVVVPSFDQLSPRKKSLKKADAETSLDKPEPPPAAAGAPADPNQPAGAAQPQPAGGQVPPAGAQPQPAGGQVPPAAGQPQPAGAQPQPAGAQAPPTAAPVQP